MSSSTASMADLEKRFDQAMLRIHLRAGDGGEVTGDRVLQHAQGSRRPVHGEYLINTEHPRRGIRSCTDVSGSTSPLAMLVARLTGCLIAQQHQWHTTGAISTCSVFRGA